LIVDAELICQLLVREHSTAAKPFIARTKLIGFH